MYAKSTLTELAALLAVLALLWLMLSPARAPGAAVGMNARYTIPAQTLAESLVALDRSPPKAADALAPTADAIAALAEQQARARELHGGLARYMVVLAGAGWMALAFGRLALPWTTQLGVLAPLWCAVAAWQGTLGASAGRWGLMGGAVFVVALTGAALQRTWSGRLAITVKQARSGAWRYPGFVLLSGLGLAWITDLAARGPLRQLFLGLRHADNLLLAFATLTMAAALAPALLWGLSSAVTRAGSRMAGMGPSLAGALVLLLLTLPSLGLALALRADAIQASLFGESARVLFWLACGWLMYRRVDRDEPSGRAFGLVVACQVLLLGFYALFDKGQAMVALLSLTVPGAVLVLPMLLARRCAALTGRARAMLGVLLWLPCLSLVLWCIWTLGPMFGNHIAARIEATQSPFGARNDFLAQLFWLSHAAGSTGFGLTHVPWCGHLGSLGSACRGAPEQIQSDYAIQGLAAVWGMPVAVALVLALCLWLMGMFRLPVDIGGGGSQSRSLLALRAWILAFFAVALVTQAFVTSFGALGAMPMTGVPLPLLAYGRVGLLVVSFFAGLSMHQWREGPATSASDHSTLDMKGRLDV